MKPLKRGYSSLCFMTLVTHASLASAETIQKERSNSFELSIGVAYQHERSLYTDGKSNESALPLIEAFWNPLFFSHGKLGSYIAGSDDWGVYLAVGLDETGDKDRGDSPLLKDMTKLKDVYAVSLGAELSQSWGDVSLSVSSDISDRHNGQTADLSYRYPFVFEQHTISPSLTLNWMSKEVTRYYYGVRQSEQTVERPSYKPINAFSAAFGLSYSYAFDRHHSVLFDTTWYKVSKEISDSPIVDNSSATSFLAAYIYRF